MLVFALAAAAVVFQPAPPSQGGVVSQARATVRILVGERVTAEKIPAAALVRDTQVTSADGSRKPARLVEFP